VGCRRCKQRGTRCVYDVQKSRGGSNSERQGGTSAEVERPETPVDKFGHNGSDRQRGTVTQESGHPWDDDGISCIQVEIPNTVPAPRQQSQQKTMSPGSDGGSRSGGGAKGSSSNHGNIEMARQSGPQSQQEGFQHAVAQADAVEQSTQTVATCPGDSDTGLFLDFTEEHLDNPYGGCAELIDPFVPEGFLLHNDMLGKLIGFVSWEARSLYRMLIQY